MLDTAVIPCGGLGTRLHPISRWLPKEVLPVALRPVLHWAFDEAADAGLLRVIVVTNPHKPMLEAVARSYAGPLELEFVPQDHPRGLGDALLRARDHLSGSAFAVLLPDNLFLGPNPTAAVLAVHRTTGLATVLLAEISREQAETKGATGRATVERSGNGTYRVVAIADKGKGRFDAGQDRAFDLHLENQGMRLLYGTVSCEDTPWLCLGEGAGVGQKLFQFGHEAIVPVQIRGDQPGGGWRPRDVG